jgi:DNA-binding response OmpR family regulator
MAEASARILLVDDEESIQTLLAYPLRREGYEVVVARDGREGLDEFAAGRFDLVVLDVMMPRIDGIEVCRRLRARSQVPIIMLTARDDEVDKVLGLEIGADDYITKPFNPRELRARLKAVLRRSDRAGHLRTFRFGDVEVDFDRHEVRRDGKPVDLTSLEFKLLGAFCRNRGRALTREQVLDLTWGPGIAVSERVVDNHVVRLRKAIEVDPGHPQYLVSVRGVGYRFDG